MDAPGFEGIFAGHVPLLFPSLDGFVLALGFEGAARRERSPGPRKRRLAKGGGHTEGNTHSCPLVTPVPTSLRGELPLLRICVHFAWNTEEE